MSSNESIISEIILTAMALKNVLSGSSNFSPTETASTSRATSSFNIYKSISVYSTTPDCIKFVSEIQTSLD